MTRLRLDRLLSNLGYCARSDVPDLIKSGRITATADNQTIKSSAHFSPEEILFDGEQLDPLELNLVMNKPAGYTCSHRDEGALIFELLPVRYFHRRPLLSIAGRLDKDTTGLLILTTNGELLHRLTSPKNHIPKKYLVHTADPLNGNENQIFSSGTLMLKDETAALLPAEFRQLSSHCGEITLHEGRYHQVKRMFAAIGNKVETLARVSIGNFLVPADLPEGNYRELSSDEISLMLNNL